MRKLAQEVKLWPVKLIQDERGDLIPVEKGEAGIPFSPKRSFFIMNVPMGAKRAQHAVDCDLFLLVLQGAVTVKVNSRKRVNNYVMESLNQGIYIPAYNYIDLVDFKPNTIVSVFASKKFEETRYYGLDELNSI
jgi:hypothetical protein